MDGSCVREPYRTRARMMHVILESFRHSLYTGHEKPRLWSEDDRGERVEIVGLLEDIEILRVFPIMGNPIMPEGWA